MHCEVSFFLISNKNLLIPNKTSLYTGSVHREEYNIMHYEVDIWMFHKQNQNTQNTLLAKCQL